MKKLFLSLAFMMAISSQAQDATVSETPAPTSGPATKFVWDKSGVTDFVVTEIPNKTQAELYKKTLDWVQTTYKNPKEVIKGQIENDYIRLNGATDNLVCISSMGKACYDSRYSIEISFKDGKYKFDVTNIEYYVPASQYAAGGWATYPMTSLESLYNKKGELRSAYKFFPLVPDYFTQLNEQLKSFLSSDTIPSKKSDW